jgi:hypothetical protein
MISSSLHVLFMTPCLFVIGEDTRQGRQRRALHEQNHRVRASA